jgi:hemolysin III
MADLRDRLTFGRMQNPVRGFLHGAAAVLSVIGAAFLWHRAPGNLPHQLPLLVFGISLIALYTASSLYHAMPWGAVWKARMQRIDHAMIYVLVAGTYTPVTCIVLEGALRWTLLAAVWGVAAVGIAQKIWWPRVRAWFSISLQTIQGWLAILLVVPLAQRMPGTALALGALGGILYTVGMVLFVIERPRLWPRVFSYHEVFHVLVVGGSASHYAMIFGYVAVLAPV